MQQAYTGYFSGPDSASLPEEVKAQQQEFEKAFLQMSTLATKLAEYQQTIAKTIAEQKPPPTTYVVAVVLTDGIMKLIMSVDFHVFVLSRCRGQLRRYSTLMLCNSNRWLLDHFRFPLLAPLSTRGCC